MSSFSDSRVVARLQREFVPVALDCVYLRHTGDRASRYFRRLADEARLNPPPREGGQPSRQGHYIATADGRLLAAHNRRGPEAVLALMDRALDRLRRRPPSDAPLPLPEQDSPDPRRVRTLPPGGLRLDVYTRILRWQPGALDALPEEFRRWNRERTGFDHLWIWPDELAGFVPPEDAAPGHTWPAPRRVAHRLARFHLVDNVRGEPDMYHADEIACATWLCRVERIDGSRVTVRMDGAFALDASGDAHFPRTFHGALAGRAVWDQATRRWLRFDLYVEGDATGRGRWSPGAPRGRYRLAIGCELIPPAMRFAADVPPQGMRTPGSYRRP